MIYHPNTANGGSIADSSALDTLYFYNLTGDTCVSSGEYPAKRFTINKDITYSQSYIDTPYVWGVGYDSKGWSDSDTNYCTGYCSVVDSSADGDGCQLQTFIYRFYDPITLKSLGWFPCEADSVSYKYRVWGELSNERKWTDDSNDINIPTQLRVLGNHPNPFNSTTTIRFGISEAAHVKISIYNLLGEKVTSLIDKHMVAGSHSIIWDSRNDKGKRVASGIYFYTIGVDNKLEVKRMTLLK